MKNPEEAGWKSVDDCVQRWEVSGKNSFYKGCECLKKGKKGNAYVECYEGTEGALLKSIYTNTSWTVIVAIAIVIMLIGSMIVFWKPLKRALKKLTTN